MSRAQSPHFIPGSGWEPKHPKACELQGEGDRVPQDDPAARGAV